MLNGYAFTERVRMVLAAAREEAVAFDHEYVGTEHLLLALLRARDGVAAAALDTMHVDADAMRETVLSTVRRGRPRAQEHAPTPPPPPPPPTGPFGAIDRAFAEVFGAMRGAERERPVHGPDLPYTSRAKKVLELSMREARDLGHSYVGSEHLLLGLVAEEKGIAAQILMAAGVTLDVTRSAIRTILGSPAGAGTSATPAAPHAAPPSASRAAAPNALDERAAWARVRSALDVCHAVGATPTVTLDGDGALVVSLTAELAVRVPFPADVEIVQLDDAAADASGAPPEPLADT